MNENDPNIAFPIREYIKEYVSSEIGRVSERISATDRLHDQESVATARAIDKAEQQMNSRLLGMNEFREQLKDQASTFAKKDQVDDIRFSLQKRLDEIDRIIANWQGRLLVVGSGWAVIVIIMGALVNYTIKTLTPATLSAPVIVTPTTSK